MIVKTKIEQVAEILAFLNRHPEFDNEQTFKGLLKEVKADNLEADAVANKQHIQEAE